jgi:hypothetical protein
MVAYGFKKQFIEPIMIGLGAPLSVDAFAAGMDEFGNVARPRGKRQTIRAIGKRRHARPGETIQLYTAMRTKQCRKLGEARCLSVQPIKLFIGPASIGVDIDGEYFCGSTRTKEFAQSDGFADVEEMIRFWMENHPGAREFSGMLIKWEPLNG